MKIDERVYAAFGLWPFGEWFLWLLEPVWEKIVVPFKMMGMADEDIHRVVSQGTIVALGLIKQAVADLKEAEQYGKELVGYSPYRL